MAKKKELDEVLKDLDLVPAVVLKVTPLSGDFGRADLNGLKDKLNEVIAHINK